MLQSRMRTSVACVKSMKLLSMFSNMNIRRCAMNQIHRNPSRSSTFIHSVLADFEKCLCSAVKHIQLGNVIAIPTDTVYGLAVDAENLEAVQKLYQIKGRDSSKAVAICVHNVQSINRWGHGEHLSEKMLNELLPGPVTIVLKKTSMLNSQLNPDHDKIAIRIPDYKFVQKLTTTLQKPIALTSANKSGDASSVTIEEFSYFWSSLDAVFDGGTTGIARAGSTIVDVSFDGEYEILREGGYLNSTLMILNKYGLKRIP